MPVNPTPEMIALLSFLATRSGIIYLTDEQAEIAEKCDPEWIALGKGEGGKTVAILTPVGRELAMAEGDKAHKEKSAQNQTGLKHAQEIVNEIVKRMVAAHYPVECTHKNGHKPDYIPCDSYGGWSDKINNFANGVTFFESNLASVLVGGWHSKAALVQLLIEIRRYTRENS